MSKNATDPIVYDLMITIRANYKYKYHRSKRSFQTNSIMMHDLFDILYVRHFLYLSSLPSDSLHRTLSRTSLIKRKDVGTFDQ
jgi:hypothetical protein